MAILSNYSIVELLFVLGCILILSYLLAEYLDLSKLFTADCLCEFGYEFHNGPLTWKNRYPHSRGNSQSPINIKSTYAIEILVETEAPIQFSADYYTVPKFMGIMNDSHGVILYACWNQCTVPTICGGPLVEPHQFVHARFRWGPNKYEGSEHTINDNRFAMEVQAVHVKSEYKNCPLVAAAEASAVVIVSYLYKVTCTDNPYIDTVIKSLELIKYAYSQSEIEPVPLSWITPPFISKFYSYVGSLTMPPCTEGVTWLVQSEPLSISLTQLKKFRSLFTIEGKQLESNTRPVQEVNCRDIYFYD